MRGKKFNRNPRGNFFTWRAVLKWIKLPETIVEVGTIIAFKRHLDRYADREALGGYGLTQAGGMCKWGILVGMDELG